MSNIIAKPIIQDHFWILKDGNKKIGNIQANSSGFGVNLNGKISNFNTTEELKKKTRIKFDNIVTQTTVNDVHFSLFPTPDTVYNSMLDRHGLHVFTVEPNSKCKQVAGWFLIKNKNSDDIVFCPKYIYIERYKYFGPFATKEEAENSQ